MTAYSFGNRWVGILALREPPPPEPLHKLALRLRLAVQSRVIHVGDLEISSDQLLPLLSQIRYRQGLAAQMARASECLRVEQSLRAGRIPEMRPWLQEEVAKVVTRNAALHEKKSEVGVPAQAIEGGDESDVDPDRVVETGWATGYPLAADSPWLPALPKPLARQIELLGLELDDEAARWVRWACLHSSYLYEAVPDSPIAPGVLEVLAMLGRGWIRVALVDRAREQWGEFASSNEVSMVLAGDKQVRAALGAWAGELGVKFYGKGEAGLQAAGRRSSAPESVALQIVGALSLVTASQAAADGVLSAIDYRAPEPEHDWLNLLVSELKTQPKFTQSDEGPDHEKTFCISVSAAGRTASASSGSVKAARKVALRQYVTDYLPHAMPKSRTAVVPPSPRAYLAVPHQHARAVAWAQRAFEVADDGLMSQALTHRSWTYENARLVSAANQRDYGTLASEGSEILTQLARHQYALQILNASFRLPLGLATSPSVTGEAVAELFDRMPIASGVLRSRGLSSDADFSTDLREDVSQAIVAAAWRANGDLLAERQPLLLSRWIRGFTPPADPTTQLQEYCSRAKVAYDFDYEERGPDHERECRASLSFDVEGHSSWVGDWRKGKTQAKHSAAAGALNHLLGDVVDGQTDGSPGGAKFVRGFFLAELRAITPDDVNHQRELANGTLGVDLLAAADYASFTAWSATRSALIPETASALPERLAVFYESVISGSRRDGITAWILRHTPTRGGQSADPAARIRSWWAGSDSGMLVLLDDLLVGLRESDVPAAMISYLETQAQAVAEAAGAELETERADNVASLSLTIRVSGMDLGAAFDPVIRLSESAGIGAMWTKEPDGLSVAIPTIPSGSNVLSAAAMRATRNAMNDQWLFDVHSALSNFLGVTESVLGADSEPSPASMDKLSLAELSLILQLRSTGEEDE